MTGAKDVRGFQEFGPVRIKFEPPDIIHAQITGEAETSHVAAAFDAMNEAFRTSRPYILRDSRQGGAPPRAVREFIIRDSRIHRVTALVCYGAPYHVRVVIAMIDKALRLLRPSAPRLVFVETCEQGRAWIEADRRRHTIDARL
jgi:hypothetical protein